MLTVYLGVTDDPTLYHLLSFPEDYDPAGVAAAADATLEPYPAPYNVVTWAASTGPDPASITQTLAEHYGVEIVPAPGTLSVTAAPDGPPGGILAALEQRDQDQA